MIKHAEIQHMKKGQKSEIGVTKPCALIVRT